MLAAPGPD